MPAPPAAQHLHRLLHVRLGHQPVELPLRFEPHWEAAERQAQAQTLGRGTNPRLDVLVGRREHLLRRRVELPAQAVGRLGERLVLRRLRWELRHQSQRRFGIPGVGLLGRLVEDALGRLHQLRVHELRRILLENLLQLLVQIRRVPSPSKHAVRAEQERPRCRHQTASTASLAVEGVQPVHLVLNHERLHVADRPVEAHADDLQALQHHLLIRLHHVRDFLPARRAPRRPEVEEHHLALELFGAERLAVDGLELEVDRLADRDLGPPVIAATSGNATAIAKTAETPRQTRQSACHVSPLDER